MGAVSSVISGLSFLGAVTADVYEKGRKNFEAQTPEARKTITEALGPSPNAGFSASHFFNAARRLGHILSSEDVEKWYKYQPDAAEFGVVTKEQFEAMIGYAIACDSKSAGVNQNAPADNRRQFPAFSKMPAAWTTDTNFKDLQLQGFLRDGFWYDPNDGIIYKDDGICLPSSTCVEVGELEPATTDDAPLITPALKPKLNGASMRADKTTLAYARAFTKSSFYDELGMCLLSVSLQVSALTATGSLCASLFIGEVHSHLSAHFCITFASLLVVSCLLWIGLAARFAVDKVNADRSFVSDFEHGVSTLARARLLATITLFTMFNVPSIVQDAVTFFHPEKAVQPYMMTTDPYRAWVLGWVCKEQYDFEKSLGLLMQLPKKLLGDLPLLFMQFYIQMTLNDSLLARVSFAMSLTTLGKGLWDTWHVWLARQKVYSHMMAQLGKLRSVQTRHDANRVLVACRYLEQHFGQKPPPEAEQMAVDFGWANKSA